MWKKVGLSLPDVLGEHPEVPDSPSAACDAGQAVPGEQSKNGEQGDGTKQKRTHRRWSDGDKQMAIASVENKKIKEGAEMFGITEKKLKQYVTLWKEQEAVKKGER